MVRVEHARDAGAPAALVEVDVEVALEVDLGGDEARGARKGRGEDGHELHICLGMDEFVRRRGGTVRRE